MCEEKEGGFIIKIAASESDYLCFGSHFKGHRQHRGEEAKVGVGAL